MEIEDYISKAAARTKTSFSKDKGKWIDYLMKYDLKNYFSENVPEEKKVMLKGALERIVDDTSDKYKRQLGGLVKKTAAKGTMGLAVANDIYAYISNAPIANVTGLGYALFGIKTAAELPAVYRYLKKSHDWYGALKHFALKPLRYLIPVVGPALESGAFERMVRKKVIKEAKTNFLKEFGKYVPVTEIVKEKLGTPVAKVIEMPG